MAPDPDAPGLDDPATDPRRVRLPGGETPALTMAEVRDWHRRTRRRIAAHEATEAPTGRRDRRLAKLYPDEPGPREAVVWARVPAYTRPATPRLHVPTGDGPGKRAVRIDLDASTMKARLTSAQAKAKSEREKGYPLTLADVVTADRRLRPGERPRLSVAALRRALGEHEAAFLRNGILPRKGWRGAGD